MDIIVNLEKLKAWVEQEKERNNKRSIGNDNYTRQYLGGNSDGMIAMLDWIEENFSPTTLTT